jgi:hypothetical protein
MTLTSQETRNLEGDIKTHREKDDFISLITKIKRGCTERQQGNLISLFLFLSLIS